MSKEKGRPKTKHQAMLLLIVHGFAHVTTALPPFQFQQVADQISAGLVTEQGELRIFASCLVLGLRRNLRPAVERQLWVWFLDVKAITIHHY